MAWEGIEPQAFKHGCRRGARILYTTPTLQNPTTVTMSAARRQEIAHIAETYDVAILEDDVLGFLAPEAPLPVSPYAPANTYYLLRTSKGIAPGLPVASPIFPLGVQRQAANTSLTT